MALYNFSGVMTWKRYLKKNSFIVDSKGALRKSRPTLDYSVSEGFIENIGNEETLARIFGKNFVTLGGTLFRTVNFGVESQKVGSLHYPIEELGAAFEWGMSLLLFQLGAKRKLFDEIIESQRKINKTINAPALSDAMDSYLIGRNQLERGLLVEALESFIEAEGKNNKDFLTQYSLGYLRLYGMDNNCDLIDILKAKKHFLNSALYARAESPKIPMSRIICGEALLNASIAFYVHATENMLYGNKKKARQLIYNSAKLAINAGAIYPRLSESFYQLARTSALLGKVDIAIKSLIRAIIFDRNYCIKADNDDDFFMIRPDIFKLFRSLRSHEKKMAEKVLYELYTLPNKAPWLKKIDKKNMTQIKKEILKAKNYHDKGKLFDYLDCSDLCARVMSKIKNLNELQIQRYYENQRKKKSWIL